MFLELAHTKLDIFQVSKKFVLICYKETIGFSPDAVPDIAVELGYTSKDRSRELGLLMIRGFQMISKMIS